MVTESSSVDVNLTVLDMASPFPPDIFSQWTFDGQNVSTTSMIMLRDYDITFNNILRNYSGQYSLTVTNTVGSTTGSFVLDVQCKSTNSFINYYCHKFLFIT